MEDSNQPSKTQKPKAKSPRKSSNDHVIKKRLSGKPSRRENDIYITTKTNFQAQLGKCKKILEPGDKDIVLHALGGAVLRVMNLALHIKEAFLGSCEIEVNTSTVNIVDDLHPLSDDADFATQRRMNSAVHIRVFRIGPFTTQQQ